MAVISHCEDRGLPGGEESEREGGRGGVISGGVEQNKSEIKGRGRSSALNKLSYELKITSVALSIISIQRLFITFCT